MTSLTHGVAAIACATCLSACASHNTPDYNDGIAESAPVGTNIKSKDGYRRGGSSSTVKVIGRHQLRDQPGNNADQLANRDDSSQQR